MSDSSRDESDCDERVSGYCHFSESGSNTFNINIFGYELRINQLPSSRNLGHGAVVWDAAVVFAKYMENSPSLFNLTSLGGLHDDRILAHCLLILSCLQKKEFSNWAPDVD